MNRFNLFSMHLKVTFVTRKLFCTNLFLVERREKWHDGEYRPLPFPHPNRKIHMLTCVCPRSLFFGAVMTDCFATAFHKHHLGTTPDSDRINYLDHIATNLYTCIILCWRLKQISPIYNVVAQFDTNDALNIFNSKSQNTYHLSI